VWVVFFGIMLYMASAAVVADLMSFHGMVKEADKVFPFHRAIQQRAE
jgi:hypothetical protein